jgi:hypothetical protein
MNWIILFWVLLYIVVGWFLTELCDLTESVDKFVIFIAWPVIFGGFLIVGTMMLTFGLTHIFTTLIYNLIHKGD